MPELCRSLKESEQPRTAVEWFKKLTTLREPERCGAPATVQTVVGPMCAPCAERFEERTRSGKNLLGLLVELRKESKK